MNLFKPLRITQDCTGYYIKSKMQLTSFEHSISLFKLICQPIGIRICVGISQFMRSFCKIGRKKQHETKLSLKAALVLSRQSACAKYRLLTSDYVICSLGLKCCGCVCASLMRTGWCMAASAAPVAGKFETSSRHAAPCVNTTSNLIYLGSYNLETIKFRVF